MAQAAVGPLNLLRGLLFFPSINFNLMTAEIFPWAMLYSLVKLRVAPLSWILFFSVILLSALFAWGMSQRLVFVEMVRSLAAYANPLLLFLVAMHCSHEELDRLNRAVRWAVAVMLLVALAQLSGVAANAEFVIKALIARGEGTLFGGGRGVTVLATEPSRAAIEFMFVYALLRMLASPPVPVRLFMDFCAVCFVLFGLRSVVGVAFLGIFALLHYPIFSILGLVAIASVAAIVLDNRFFVLVADLVASGSLDDAAILVFNQSGFRAISVIGSYLHALTAPLGAGVGNWEQSSVEAMRELGFGAREIAYFRTHTNGEFVGVRPASFGANVALDMGVVGLVSLIGALASYARRELVLDRELRVISAMFVFYVFFLGSVGDPVPWLVMALAYRWHIDPAEPLALSAREPARASNGALAS